MRRKHVLLGSVGACVALAGASVAVLRSLPVVSDGEVEEARRYFADLSNAQAATRCVRAPLRGRAIPGSDDDAFRELFAPDGPFAECTALENFEAVDDALVGEVGGGRRWRWNFEPRDVHDGVPLAPGWDGNIRFAAPPYPEEHLPPALRHVSVACAGLAEATAEIVAHVVVCSPWQVGHLTGTSEFIRIVRHARGLRILAHDLARDGDGLGAVAMLLDGLRLAQDVRRGGVNFLAAMISVAATGLLVSEMQTVLALDLGFSDAEIATIRAELDALVDSEPHPIEILRAEAVYVVDQVLRAPLEAPGWVPPGGVDPEASAFGAYDAEAARTTLVAYRGLLAELEAACAAHSGLADCLEGVRALGAARTPEHRHEYLVLALGPHIDRGATLGGIRRDILAMMPDYVRRLVTVVAMMRGLRAIVGFSARRQDDSCPGVAGFAAEDLVVPSVGNLTVFEFADDQQFELHAPAVLSNVTPVTGALPMLFTLCPKLPVERAGTFEPLPH